MMGESPFSLASGTKAVLLPEVVFPTLQVTSFEEGALEEGLRANLDLLEEKSAEAHLRALAYKKASGNFSLQVGYPLLGHNNCFERKHSFQFRYMALELGNLKDQCPKRRTWDDHSWQQDLCLDQPLAMLPSPEMHRFQTSCRRPPSASSVIDQSMVGE
ncbi:hypothetical protein BHM03_00025367 [Ensete ventricosum]|nr:hypothetical protein BHM03_00025367 [Ensete ventricosum]